MVFDELTAMITNQLKAVPEKVTREARLVEDLGADSANVMVLIMDIEDHYGIQVEDSAITSLKTVGDVVDYIEEKTK